MRAFRGYLITGGVPVGIMIALSTAILGPNTSWLDFTLTTAICALALAGLLTVVTEPLIKTFRRSALTVGVMIVFVTLTTLIGGMGLLETADRVPHGQWSRLPDPPEPVRFFAGPTCQRLVGHDDGAILLARAAGRYLAYHGKAEGWTREASAPESLRRRDAGCRPRYTGPGPPMKSGQIIASYHIDLDGSDCGGRRDYRLLADGSIWEWSDGACALSWFLGRVVFAIALLLVSIVVIYTRLRFGWSKQLDPSPRSV
jgi:hypothetical protein